MATRRSPIFDGVDPRLVAAIKRASANSPYEVEIISGYRPGDPRQHGRGNAIDVQLIDRKTGARLPHYQDPKNVAEYQAFAHKVREDALKNDPKLAQQMRWGGYFSGPKGKYGAFDLMHFDTAGHIGMAGGSWDKGFTPASQKTWGIAALPGGAPPTGPRGPAGSWPIARVPEQARNIAEAGARPTVLASMSNNASIPTQPVPQSAADASLDLRRNPGAATAPAATPEVTSAATTVPGAPISPAMSRIAGGHEQFGGEDASPLDRINQGFNAAYGKPVTPMERIAGGHDQFSGRPMLGSTTSPPPGASPPPYPNPRPQDAPLQVQTRDVPPEELAKPLSSELAGAPGSTVDPPAEPVPTNVAKGPEIPPADKKKGNWADAIGDALEGLGKSASATASATAAKTSGPTTIAMPMSTPMSPVPMVDPKRAEAQRQMLAIAMQRLNSGKLV